MNKPAENLLLKPALNRLIEIYSECTPELISGIKKYPEDCFERNTFVIMASKQIIQMFEQIIRMAEAVENNKEKIK